MKLTFLTLTISLMLAAAALANHTPGHTKSLVLKNKEGAAMLGYDAVAYFTEGKPAKGNPKFKSS